MGLTTNEAGRLIWLCVLASVTMLVAKMVLPLHEQPFLIIGATGYIGVIYMAVPAGRGSTDFKVGVFVGATIVMMGYEFLAQVGTLLRRGV